MLAAALVAGALGLTAPAFTFLLVRRRRTAEPVEDSPARVAAPSPVERGPVVKELGFAPPPPSVQAEVERVVAVMDTWLRPTLVASPRGAVAGFAAEGLNASSR